MGSAALLVLFVGAGLACANWWSRWRSDDRLELWTKPAVTVCVIVLALVLDEARPSARPWCIAALVACLVGDVALLPQVDRFVTGLGAFLVGHGLFVGAALSIGVHRDAALGAAAGFAVCAGTIGIRIVRHSGSMRIPVVAYFCVIGAMAVTAIGTQVPAMAVGAIAFVASDSILGWNRFVRPLGWAPVAVMVTYHAALVGLTVGIA